MVCTGLKGGSFIQDTTAAGGGFRGTSLVLPGGHADVEVRLGALEAVETGEGAFGKSLQACEDFGLHVAHDFGEAVDDSLFGGGDGRGDIALSCGSVFGGDGVCVVRHRVAPPLLQYMSSVAGLTACGLRVLNRFGESWPEMRRKPGTDTNFRRSLPKFGCLSQGLPNGTGCPFVVSPKRLSTRQSSLPPAFQPAPGRARKRVHRQDCRPHVLFPMKVR